MNYEGTEEVLTITALIKILSQTTTYLSTE